MTKQELLEKLANLVEYPPAAHEQADLLLIKFINDPDIAAAYERLQKWYE